MWVKVSSFIIRKRLTLLAILCAITAFMAYHAKEVKVSQEFAQIIPKTDPDYQDYLNFKEKFGEDGNLFVMGYQSSDIFKLENFRDWHDITETISEFEGVSEVLSITNLIKLEKNVEERKFVISQISKGKPESQEAVDLIKEEIENQPLYDKMIYNAESNVTFLAIRLDDETLYSENRITVSNRIIELGEAFAEKHGTTIHYSGLPYIRTIMATKVANELEFFIFLAVVITAIILLIFFRSLYAVIFPLIVIGIIITWTLGSIELFDFRITLLTALIPPIIVVICVPNFIYFLNKYHVEYKKHGNKMRAITRMVQKIGIITFLTNASTAIGFGVLALTQSPVLKEFGLITSINILATFFVSLIIIPVVFSFMPNPSIKQTNYLNRKSMNRIIRQIAHLVNYRRAYVYTFFICIVIISIIGITKLKAVGYILDDIPHNHEAYQDLRFFERHFNGVMPFEIMVDTRRENGLRQMQTLSKISRIQDSLKTYPEFAKSLSIADFAKFTNQAYFEGGRNRYELPGQREQSFIRPYLSNMDNEGEILENLTDSENRIARINTQVADIGSVKLRELIADLDTMVNTVFENDDFEVTFTGNSLIFLKSNQYLITSLVQSMTLAFALIALIMGFLFKRIRMVLLSLIPNFIPLIITAGIMGYAGIPLKPSTILVFSIAFGISIDDTLHFLGKYKQELRYHNWNISKTVGFALKETGTSMIYTSLVLFFGFIIFYFSSFGGTQALGILTSVTLIVAMLTNLVLLPSLILTFDKRENKIA